VRVATANRLFDHHELVAVWVRQRPQQELIDDREDGGVAADAEGQRQDHGERKAWAEPETTSGVSDVSRDIFCKVHRASLHQLLLDLRDTAKLAACRVQGLSRIHAAAHEALLEHCQMLPEFVVQFLVQPRSAQRSANA
jgi:hypothetical protein